ncbi:MAG: tRNA (adenosine(37)-N6)-threonylcarbamoyltransferase complex ATPase subunit type 1 TsaE, partial [Candidatus Veblenbacteria bacterium]|nr:tRNA (adenosine(37)-N6)-threonylcarbamoyltransferase complex ATPase subunit type 1 TsaE [Candidatus Veblenbacteria bacterium]
MRPKTFTTTSASQTRALGTKLAGELKGGELLALTGHLGSGKTTFLKGLAKGLGVKDTVTSPTFVLMKVYPAKHKNIRTFVHVDCYRLPAGRHGV